MAYFPTIETLPRTRLLSERPEASATVFIVSDVVSKHVVSKHVVASCLGPHIQGQLRANPVNRGTPAIIEPVTVLTIHFRDKTFVQLPPTGKNIHGVEHANP